ncbi:MAG: hypothetical protein ACJAUP_000343 [Cellvibrionaceae bacterium]|jgi:hypothetical protein
METDYNVETGSDGKKKATYGFNAHIYVDDDGFIKAIGFTAGNVHGSQYFTEWLSLKTAPSCKFIQAVLVLLRKPISG